MHKFSLAFLVYLINQSLRQDGRAWNRGWVIWDLQLFLAYLTRINVFYLDRLKLLWHFECLEGKFFLGGLSLVQDFVVFSLLFNLFLVALRWFDILLRLSRFLLYEARCRNLIDNFTPIERKFETLALLFALLSSRRFYGLSCILDLLKIHLSSSKKFGEGILLALHFLFFYLL